MCFFRASLGSLPPTRYCIMKRSILFRQLSMGLVPRSLVDAGQLTLLALLHLREQASRSANIINSVH